MKEKILNDYLLKQQKIDIEKVMDEWMIFIAMCTLLQEIR